MYTQPAIDVLVSRIGWSDPMQPTTIVLSYENSESTSGRVFDAFHPKVTADVVEMCMPIANIILAPNPDNDTLNNFLYKLKVQAVLKVLSRVFDTNDRAKWRIGKYGCRTDISGIDWTAQIMNFPSKFDDAYGYQLAYDALLMMITTSRSNFQERSMTDKGQLRIEQNGIIQNGVKVVDGVLQKLENALASISDDFFPLLTKRPTLTGRNIW